ncbi:hypothetical protein GGR53DRAFT_486189 [Hypoxylon sp. FL1150]|nr:hypothetical protein GGR53DRAFT_486189 [Hypoxylon sp. FL1150]
MSSALLLDWTWVFVGYFGLIWPFILGRHDSHFQRLFFSLSDSSNSITRHGRNPGHTMGTIFLSPVGVALWMAWTVTTGKGLCHASAGTPQKFYPLSLRSHCCPETPPTNVLHRFAHTAFLISYRPESLVNTASNMIWGQYLKRGISGKGYKKFGFQETEKRRAALHIDFPGVSLQFSFVFLFSPCSSQSSAGTRTTALRLYSDRVLETGQFGYCTMYWAAPKGCFGRTSPVLFS